MKRVVVTGLGLVSPIGNSVSDSWQAILDGMCGISRITAFDCQDFTVSLAGEVKDLNLEKYLNKRELKFNDRFTQFARYVGFEAMNDAKLNDCDFNHDRFGVILSSGIGGLDSIEAAQTISQTKGPKKVSPFFIPMALINLASAAVAIDHQAKGYVSSVVTACAAATNAIGEAYHRIKYGYEDIMLAGGSEAAITPLGVAGFGAMRALHTGDIVENASIPFDKRRSGFVMGEGAGILVLEELDHALARNAHIYGEIVGYGVSCDAYHVTAPLSDGSGGARAMLNALDEAGLKPEQIDYLNAHGTSTPLNDSTESKSINSVFKNHPVYVSSTKSNTGHLLGASGALESIICLKALEKSYIPPTINLKEQDETCDINVVKKGINQHLNYVMKNSLGFGGHNASLIFKRWDE